MSKKWTHVSIDNNTIVIVNRLEKNRSKKKETFNNDSCYDLKYEFGKKIPNLLTFGFTTRL